MESVVQEVPFHTAEPVVPCGPEPTATQTFAAGHDTALKPVTVAGADGSIAQAWPFHDSARP